MSSADLCGGLLLGSALPAPSQPRAKPQSHHSFQRVPACPHPESSSPLESLHTVSSSLPPALNESVHLPQPEGRKLLYQCIFCKFLLATLATSW